MFKNRYPFVSIVKELLEVKGIYFFLLLCLLSFLLLFIKKNFVEYEITAFQILDERGEMGMFKIISGLQYLSIPLVYLLKFFLLRFSSGWVALALATASPMPTAGTSSWCAKSYLCCPN